MRSRLSATSLAWFSISTIAIGSIGGIRSGLWGYTLPEVMEVAIAEEPLLEILIRLDLLLLTLDAAITKIMNK